MLEWHVAALCAERQMVCGRHAIAVVVKVWHIAARRLPLEEEFCLARMNVGILIAAVIVAFRRPHRWTTATYRPTNLDDL